VPSTNETTENQTAGEAQASERGNSRVLVGVVTSDKMQKTVVVQVTRRVKTPKFGKYVTKRIKYKAHSENNEFHVGDTVQIVESRPLSKDKRWRVQKLVERARTA
jgi:small subunit ribosomal protein S17